MQIRKTLMAMNVLAKVFPDIEERANRILESLKTGGSETLDPERHEDCLAGVVPLTDEGKEEPVIVES
jgi:hypothetical protein